MNHFDEGHLIDTAARGRDPVYVVTVQFRNGETVERKWASAEDAADAIFLTLTHLADKDKARVERVLVKEQA